jgi:hypothetical protein
MSQVAPSCVEYNVRVNQQNTVLFAKSYCVLTHPKHCDFKLSSAAWRFTELLFRDGINTLAVLFDGGLRLNWRVEQNDEKSLRVFYIIMGADVLDENIHRICYYCSKLVKRNEFLFYER